MAIEKFYINKMSLFNNIFNMLIKNPDALFVLLSKDKDVERKNLDRFVAKTICETCHIDIQPVEAVWNYVNCDKGKNPKESLSNTVRFICLNMLDDNFSAQIQKNPEAFGALGDKYLELGGSDFLYGAVCKETVRICPSVFDQINLEWKSDPKNALQLESIREIVAESQCQTKIFCHSHA